QRRQAKRKSHWMNRVSEAKSVRTLLKSGIAQLRDAQVPSYTLAAELLLLHVLGRDRTWMYSHPEEEISLVNAEHYSALIRRRAAGEPTQHLTGKQEFWGLEFLFAGQMLGRFTRRATTNERGIVLGIHQRYFFFGMGIHPCAIAAQNMKQ